MMYISELKWSRWLCVLFYEILDKWLHNLLWYNFIQMVFEVLINLKNIYAFSKIQDKVFIKIRLFT